MKKTIFICVILLFQTPLIVQAQKASEKKLERQEKDNLNFEATKKLIESGEYNFWADRLIAGHGISKSLATTPNNINLKEGMADISLPYYGEVRANSPYEADMGIKYEGPVDDYTVDIKENKRRILVKFDIDRGIEEHNFIMTINKDGYTRVTVISSGRTSITYFGRTRASDVKTGF
jgi:hypothetical protein